MKYIKSMKFQMAVDVFVIVGWFFIFIDAAHRAIVGSNTALWIDIVFMALAIYIIPTTIIEFKKKRLKK
ncbi:hypothetical protein COK00_11230 [Bacillus cereus]|uniref:hypothetical protein n=1 Tax=Bacillus cereus TaxID=1396 RepID=UPI000BF50FD3|nr:hypothetical protein [Bacillus cereus]PFP65189.1 hypothetical protein COK00_11230 [Bacillus cereus]PGT10252.1 hypothetical protein COD03_21130 [Bacillus cereus]